MERMVLYVARGGLPTNALGVRIEQIGRLLNECGYKVHYICNQYDNTGVNSKYTKIEKAENYYLADEESHYLYGNNVYSYNEYNTNRLITTIHNYKDIINAKDIYRRVTQYCNSEHPCGIILYNDAYFLTKKLISFCRKRDIKLIADSTEWPDRGGKTSLINIINAELVNRRFYKLDKYYDGAIAISNLIKNHFEQEKVNTIWIPPLIDIGDFGIENINKKINKPITFCYAGSPGNKDLIMPFVDAVNIVNKEKIKVRLLLIGIDDKYLLDNGCRDRKGIVAMGRMDRGDALSYLKQSDFSVLMRKRKRYALAGFSTKLAESMRFGVPVFANKIGGSDVVIESWINGILIESVSTKEILDSIKRILSLDYEKMYNMKCKAFSDAEILFNINTYCDEFRTNLISWFGKASTVNE